MPDAWDRVADVLSDFDLLQAKIGATHQGEPHADVFARSPNFAEAVGALPDVHPRRHDVERLHRAIDASSHFLKQTPALLVQQVFNAWQWGGDHLGKFVASAESACPVER